MESPAARLRPLSVVDQLDASLRLYRQHLGSFAGIAALLQVPALLLLTLYQVFVYLPAQQALLLRPGQVPDQSLFLGSLGASCGLFLLSLFTVLLVGNMTSGALSYAISQAYLGQTITIGQAYRYVLSGQRLISLIVASILMGIVFTLLTLLSFVCIGLPLFVYVYLRWMTVPQVIVLEDRGPLDALSRAWTLAQGHLLRALGLALISFLALLFLYLGITAVFYLIFGVAIVAAGVDPLSLQTLNLLLESGVQGLARVVVLPIFLGATTLFYYDLRVRKEGYDLSLQAGQLLTGLGEVPA